MKTPAPFSSVAYCSAVDAVSIVVPSLISAKPTACAASPAIPAWQLSRTIILFRATELFANLLQRQASPPVLGMQLFTIGQHGDELGDLPGTGFSLFDVLNSEKDGVPVLAIERGKECPGRFVGI